MSNLKIIMTRVTFVVIASVYHSPRRGTNTILISHLVPSLALLTSLILFCLLQTWSENYSRLQHLNFMSGKVRNIWSNLCHKFNIFLFSFCRLILNCSITPWSQNVLGKLKFCPNFLWGSQFEALTPLSEH